MISDVPRLISNPSLDRLVVVFHSLYICLYVRLTRTMFILFICSNIGVRAKMPSLEDPHIQFMMIIKSPKIYRLINIVLNNTYQEKFQNQKFCITVGALSQTLSKLKKCCWYKGYPLPCSVLDSPTWHHKKPKGPVLTI